MPVEYHLKHPTAGQGERCTHIAAVKNTGFVPGLYYLIQPLCFL